MANDFYIVEDDDRQMIDDQEYSLWVYECALKEYKEMLEVNKTLNILAKGDDCGT
jgi:hypothetical protein